MMLHATTQDWQYILMSAVTVIPFISSVLISIVAYLNSGFSWYTTRSVSITVVSNRETCSDTPWSA